MKHPVGLSISGTDMFPVTVITVITAYVVMYLVIFLKKKTTNFSVLKRITSTVHTFVSTCKNQQKILKHPELCTELTLSMCITIEFGN